MLLLAFTSVNLSTTCLRSLSRRRRAGARAAAAPRERPATRVAARAGGRAAAAPSAKPAGRARAAAARGGGREAEGVHLCAAGGEEGQPPQRGRQRRRQRC